MNDSERLAMAAHMHVALRRKVGRVTDTEWMASNPEYGLAMVDLALKHAEEKMDQELGRLALRFGAALTLRAGRAAVAAQAFSQAEALADEAKDSSPWWDSHFAARSKGPDTKMPHGGPSSTWPPSALEAQSGRSSEAPMPLRRGRYVGGLR